MSREFEKVKPDQLTDDFAKIVDGLARGGTAGQGRRPRRAGRAGRVQRRDAAGADGQAGGAASASPSISPSRRASGKIDPIVGRDEEIRQIIDILMRRRQNNPDPDRRGGRRQDGGGRGLRARIVAGDVPPPLQGRDAADARCRPAAGGRQHEGRVRAAAAPGHRGGAGLAQAHHPVHRRGAHAGRRRRRGRHGRCGQSAEAGAGARHAADDRRDHLGRVQEAHREGPGAHAALPGRAGRRARARRRRS